MDKPKVSPKDFFLWAGAMIALYASVFAFIALFFSYINYAFPDPLQYYSSDPYASGISYQMATLLVLFPVYLLLMWAIRRDSLQDPSRLDIWVRRWALVLTLFIAGVTIAVDLITLIMYFFNGELSTRFLLKVLVVLLVASAGVMHFLADMWGYWQKFPTRQRSVAGASAVLVILSIGAGFFIVGTPWQAREYRFDEQKIAYLQEIQSQIVMYWQAKKKLPVTLADLADSISGYSAPVDPQNGQSFIYEVTGELSFKLCATFGAATLQTAASRSHPLAAPPYAAKKGALMDSWYHDDGEHCFDRTIDPALYPPLTKK